ncbi:xylitol oxidase [Persicitalea jodogahamensis]|uniref:Xylitol oxidase n=1 Tax=Persicitalea jodogahamensis TaxID=402147 RepID=A0A8J3D2S3_9BACT|nr:D-arabinono-1,4-lactone oxidase [Persicitalea jodogahamensis]GHB60977.1 xylitol oxidase [Persicitalea jodogahamensis]
MTAPLYSPLVSCQAESKAEVLKNWAGNIMYSTTKLDKGQSLEEAKYYLGKYDKFKVLGTRHCFNTIADSDSRFMQMENRPSWGIPSDGKSVTVNANSRYGDLSPYIHEQGYALHNLASLPHISVAGAIATATHGSGEKNGNLASAVSELEMLTADGETVRLSREKDGEKFNAAVVHLGALGVLTKVTLDLQPTFEMTQYVYENMPLAQLQDHFDEIQASGYSVSLFTNWQSQNIAEVWVKQRADAPQMNQKEWLGATLATKNLHPIPELSAENCTAQMGVPGPWYERMPHFKMGFTPSSGDELQSEYFVPRQNAVDAIMAIARLGDQVGPYLLTSEVRAIAADNLWMSPCYQQDCITIHFTWKPDWPGVSKLLPIVERELAPYKARPHWGKLFTMPPGELEKHYPKLPEFREVVKQYDPKGKFRNAFLEKNVLGV